MEINVGKIDRIIRVVAGVVLVGLGWGVLRNNWLGFILNMLASYLLLTALTQRCWIYKKLNRNTAHAASPPPAAPPPLSQ